jgi:hypothetical protein
MEQKQNNAPLKVRLIAPWNKKEGIVPVSTITYQIDCTERNENGRSCHVTYLIKNDIVTILHGEYLDSVSDMNNMQVMNESMEEVMRDSTLKQIRSEQSAARVWLD